jgi:hypothetical protein
MYFQTLKTDKMIQLLLGFLIMFFISLTVTKFAIGGYRNADGTLKTSKFLLAMVIALILGVISTAFLWSF